MTFDSVGGRRFHLTIKLIVIACIVYFAVRSLFNSIAFTTLAFPGEPIAGIVGGFLIQFFPNVCFALASFSTGWWWWLWITVGTIFTAIDIGTNIGYRANQQRVAPINAFGNPEVTIWAVRLGYFMDVAVAWAEELIALVIGAVVSDIRDLYRLRGEENRIPDWLIFVDDAASRSRGGGGRQSNNNKQHNNNNRNNGQPQQRNNNNDPRRDPKYDGRSNQPRVAMPDRHDNNGRGDNHNNERDRIQEILNRRDDTFVETIDDRRSNDRR